MRIILITIIVLFVAGCGSASSTTTATNSLPAATTSAATDQCGVIHARWQRLGERIYQLGQVQIPISEVARYNRNVHAFNHVAARMNRLSNRGVAAGCPAEQTMLPENPLITIQ